MKESYPILLTTEKTGFTVYIPDFDINTQGEDLNDAIKMARDAIGLMGVDMENDGKVFPTPCKLDTIKTAVGETAMLVDVDFAEYRHKNKM